MTAGDAAGILAPAPDDMWVMMGSGSFPLALALVTWSFGKLTSLTLACNFSNIDAIAMDSLATHC